MTDINLVANSLRSIRHENDYQWFSQFLDSLPIPKSTRNKLKLEIQKNESRHGKLLSRADFVFSNDASFKKLTEFREKKSPTLVIHIDNGRATVFNRLNQSFVAFPCNDAAEHVDSFLELIYGSAVYRDIDATENFAALIAQLANRIRTENQSSDQELCAKFILDLTTISIAHSFNNRKTFELFAKKALATHELDFSKVISRLMSACAGFEPLEEDALLPGDLLICIEDPILNTLTVSKESFNLCISLLLHETAALDAELLASSIYKFVRPGESTGIYGHQTSHENVLLLLNPLLIDELSMLFMQGDKNTSRDLLHRMRALRFFDPTDGPGCFLSSAMRSLMELEAEILESLEISGSSEIRLENFVGLVSNSTCQQLSRLTILLTYLQCANRNSVAESRSIAEISASIAIHCGDQLESDWREYCQLDQATYILGSPRFHGSRKMSSVEKASLGKVFKGSKLGDCDFSSGWLVKSSQYVQTSYINAAFVLTNSVCQGSQVSVIWRQVFNNDARISFARPSLKWRGGTERVSEVTVVLVGLTHKNSNVPIRIFHANGYIATSVIGPYLVAGTDLIVQERNKPLMDFVPIMRKGNMPYDSGNLLFNESERDTLVGETPSVAKFLKRIVGSEEFINGKKRWCLWLNDEDLPEAMKCHEIARRIQLVAKSRLEKSDANAIRLASRPHQFRETRSTVMQTLVVPSVSSEHREYIPIGFIGSEFIVSNLAFAIYECEPWIFSLLTSKIHNVWIRTVCGALETRVRYSNTLGYNTFPFPELSDTEKKTLSTFAYEIIAERESYAEMTLGELYSDLPEPLRVRHEYLDLFVDTLFCKSRFSNDDERLECLFLAYKGKG